MRVFFQTIFFFTVVFCLWGVKTGLSQNNMILFKAEKHSLFGKNGYYLVPSIVKVDKTGFFEVQTAVFEKIKESRPNEFKEMTCQIDRVRRIIILDKKQIHETMGFDELLASFIHNGAKGIAFKEKPDRIYSLRDIRLPIFGLLLPFEKAFFKTYPDVLVNLPAKGFILNEAASAWLSKGGPEVKDLIAGAFAKEDRLIFRELSRVLKENKITLYDGEIEKYLFSQREPIRYLALRYFHGTIRRPLLNQIKKVLETDKSTRIQGLAAKVLLASNDKDFVIFSKYFDLKGSDSEKAIQAINWIAASKNQHGLSLIASSLDNANAEIAKAALEAVIKLKGKEVLIPALNKKKVSPLIKEQILDYLFALKDSKLAALACEYIFKSTATHKWVDRCVSAIEVLPSQYSVKPLLLALKSEFKDIRKKAASNLLKLKDKSGILPLFEASKKEADKEFMRGILVELIEVQSLGTLGELLDSKDDILLALTIESLGNRVKNTKIQATEAILAKLKRCLNSGSDMVKGSAIAVLGLIGGRDGLAMILTHAESRSPVIRYQIAKILGSYSDKAALSVVLKLMKDGDEKVRAEAIKSAASYDRETVFPLLLAIYKQSAGGIKKAAIYALSRLSSNEKKDILMPIFSEAISDKDEQIRIYGVEGLKLIEDPEVIKIISLVLQDASDEVREKAIIALGHKNDPKIYDSIKFNLSDKSTNIRLATIKAIAMLKIKKALPDLKECLKNEKDLKVRREAEKLIKALEQ